MSDRLRLRDLDADALATEAGQALLQDASEKLAALNSGELGAALRGLVAYARGSTTITDHERVRLMGRMELLWAAPYAVAEAPKRLDHPMGVLCAAVLARVALNAGKDVGCQEIALLTGYTSDHVASIAQEIPGHYRDTKDRRKPWRFKSSAALRRWIRERSE